MKRSVLGSRRAIIVDAGPLVAAIDRNDRHHRWARSTLPYLEAELFTCEAVVAEAGHLLENDSIAIEALRQFVARMEIVPILRDDFDTIFALMKRFGPQMDVADACLFTIAARREDCIVLTTDTRDFSTYRIPFASPEGLFADE